MGSLKNSEDNNDSTIENENTNIINKEEEQSNKEIETEQKTKEEEEEELEAVGNLVADDEWMGITIELSEVIRKAVVEDIKKNTAEFINKDNYEFGDISKEIDNKVKTEIANI